MTTRVVCWACGEGYLTKRRMSKTVVYEGIHGSIEQLSHACDACGAVLFNDGDVRDNRRAWNRFRKMAVSAPLGCEIEAMRNSAGLTQRRAAQLFGGGPVAFSKYENDELIPDEAMNKLLRLAIAFPETIQRLEELAGRKVCVQRVIIESDVVSEWPGPASAATAKQGTRSRSAVFTSNRSFEIKQSQEPSWTLQ